jgi:hypothetical protein
MGGNSRDTSTWTGWLCDKESMKTIGRTIDVVGYLERYPKSKARSLNMLFTGFFLYHHGEWLELDMHGSGLAKGVIKRSSSDGGFWVTVEGVRKEGKIRVDAIIEQKKPGSGSGEYVVDKSEQNKNIRQDFKKMGI